MTIERLTEITNTIATLRQEADTIGRALPPVKFTDLVPDRCNFKDNAFSADVERFIERHLKSIDTTRLDRDDFDKWERVVMRYTVREFLWDVMGDVTRWGVWDNEAGAFVLDTDSNPEGEDDYPPLSFPDRYEAADHAADLEEDDVASQHAFPFAWNTGWVLDGRYWANDAAASGFLVYRYDGDEYIIGIDGAGYSFKGAHFAPFYARLAAKNGWLVQTDNGPRLITME